MSTPNRRDVETLIEMLVVGFGGLTVGLVVSLLLGGLLAPLGVPLDDLAVGLVLSVVGLALGFAITAAVYLRYRDLPLSYLRIRRPTARDLGWTVLGTIAVLALALVLGVLVEFLPVSEPSDHEVIELAADRPEIMLVMVPMSVLFIGPGEELLFRGVIQSRLVDFYGEFAGIAVTSTIFALAHLPAYFGEGVWLSLAILFSLSLVIGWLYEHTDNLVVPALVHGLYNAVLFASVYVYLTTELV